MGGRPPACPRRGEGERPGRRAVAAREGPGRVEYLPLRIPRDTEIATDRAPQADPLLGVLAAVGSMPDDWRAVSQLVLQPAPADWARRHLRRSLEHALAPERAEAARSGEGPGWGGSLAPGAPGNRGGPCARRGRSARLGAWRR